MAAASAVVPAWVIAVSIVSVESLDEGWRLVLLFCKLRMRLAGPKVGGVGAVPVLPRQTRHGLPDKVVAVTTRYSTVMPRLTR